MSILIFLIPLSISEPTYKRAAAAAGAAALVAVVMGMTFAVEMVVLMGMDMVMLVGVGHAVMGVLVGMGMLVVVAVATHMIVMNMHKSSPFVEKFLLILIKQEKDIINDKNINIIKISCKTGIIGFNFVSFNLWFLFTTSPTKRQDTHPT